MNVFEGWKKPATSTLLAVVLCLGVALAGAGTAAADDGGKLSIGGKMYADLTYKSNEDKGTNVKSDDTGLGTDVKRFYLQVGYKFDDIWSATFVSDIGDHGSKRYDVFVKKAYLEAKLSDAATFRIGSADLPWVPFVEGLYGYRYVENELVDRVGFGTSADWGVHFKGTQGKVSYAAGVVNGRGYSDPTRSGSVDFTGRVSVEPVEGFTLGAGIYSGKLGKDTEENPAQHTATRYDFAANYKNEHVNIGGEYFTADNWKQVTSTATDSTDGYSMWVSVPVSKADVFARYDNVTPSKDLNPNLEDKYYNLGVQIHPVKPLLVAFVVKHEEVESGLGGNLKGVGSVLPNNKGESNEVGVWMQFKF